MNMNAFSLNTPSVFTSHHGWIETLNMSTASVSESLSQIVSTLADKAIYFLTSNDIVALDNEYIAMNPVIVRDCVLCQSPDFLHIKCAGSVNEVVDAYIDDIQYLAFKCLGGSDGLNCYEIYMADYCGLYTKYDLVVEA